MGPIFAFFEISFGSGLVESLRRLFPSGDVMMRLGDMYRRGVAHWRARVVRGCLFSLHLKESCVKHR